MFSLLLAVIYAAFISLGLPDALLGSAWPTMYRVMNVPVSYAGIVSMIISCGTVISSLMSDRAVRRLGTHLVTVISVGLTALGLFGFSSAGAFWQLCVWAVPYGLGAGSVDAALNNYIALYYRSGHMNWLHCFWGLGAMAGPYIMGACLTGGSSARADDRACSLAPAVKENARRRGGGNRREILPAPCAENDRRTRHHARVLLILRFGGHHRALGQQLPRPAAQYCGGKRRLHGFAVLHRHHGGAFPQRLYLR